MTGPNVISTVTDLQSDADFDSVPANPHKGWYWHFYDNGTHRYGDPGGERVEDFPGLSTIFLRLPWCELEPTEGQFRWELLDEVIAAHVPLGRTIAFNISCKETEPNYPYATPAWVEAAGARGQLIPSGTHHSWEPDYGDPIFLAKLRAFHEAFASRYDDKPWVEWVDIASYGDWGEGHTAASSKRDWPVEAILKHFEIYQDCYRHSPLQANDDVVGSRLDRPGAEELRRRIDEAGFALTDHSVCVPCFVDEYGGNSLRDPQWLRQASERRPVVLELDHYQAVVKADAWKEGSLFRDAITEVRATYGGFHHYPRPWLEENAAFAREMANRLGYWLFLESITGLGEWTLGESCPLVFRVRNRGVAPLYHAADWEIRLMLPSGHEVICPLEGFEFEPFAPDQSVDARRTLFLPANLPAGSVGVHLRLVDRKLGVPVRLASKTSDADGWLPVGTATLGNR